MSEDVLRSVGTFIIVSSVMGLLVGSVTDGEDTKLGGGGGGGRQREMEMAVSWVFWR